MVDSLLNTIKSRIEAAKGKTTGEDGEINPAPGKTLTGQERNKVIINPDVLMKTENNTYSFKSFLEEKKATNSEPAEDTGTQNYTGVLHELLVNRSLRDDHGAKLVDFDPKRETVDAAHDRIAKKLYGEKYKNHPEYKDAVAKAKGAANTIRENEGNRWKSGSTETYWTSKHGDVEKVTGKPASQKGDSSDLYIRHPHLKGTSDEYLGASLKNSKKRNADVPFSNGGRADVDKRLGTTTDHHVNSARAKLIDQFKLHGLSTAQIKERIKKDPKLKAAEASARKEMLTNIANTWGESFQKMNPQEKAAFARESMRANSTGNRHIRVTSGGENGKFSHDSFDPTTSHDEFLNDPENIKTEVHGNSVRFFHQHPTTGKRTALFQLRTKSAGSEGIFGSQKTSGEHYREKSLPGGRKITTSDPIQTEVEPKGKSSSSTTTSTPSNEPERHHTLFWGRANPPHAGHEEAAKMVRDVTRKTGGTGEMVLTRTQDTKKNPLTPEQKLKHAKRAFPNVNVNLADKNRPTILQHLSKLHEQGVTHLHMVAGSDRIPEYQKLIEKYNGVKGDHGYFNFKNVQFHSSGERDPDSEGTAGVSASSQRQHAMNGNYKGFASGASSKMKPQHVKELYNDVRAGMSTQKPKKKVSVANG